MLPGMRPTGRELMQRIEGRKLRVADIDQYFVLRARLLGGSRILSKLGCAEVKGACGAVVGRLEPSVGARTSPELRGPTHPPGREVYVGCRALPLPLGSSRHSAEGGWSC